MDIERAIKALCQPSENISRSDAILSYASSETKKDREIARRNLIGFLVREEAES